MSEPTIIVMGLGNILCGDDGFGPIAAERLYEQYDFPPRVEFVDGGTQGSSLFQFVERAERLLLLDAVDFGLPPGTVVRRGQGEIPLWLGARKITIHQNSFAETLALAELKDASPEELELVGVQPLTTEFGAKMSAVVLAKIPEAIELALACLRAWQVEPRPAAAPKSMLTRELLSSRFYHPDPDGQPDL